MKTNSSNNKAVAGSSPKPFFNKSGKGGFFGPNTKGDTPFFQPLSIQRDLAIGKADDPYEREADKIGRQVMDGFGQAASIQRMVSTYGIQTSLAQLMPAGLTISRRLQRRRFGLQANFEDEDKTARPRSLGLQFAGDGAMVSPGIEARIKSHQGGGRPMDTVTRSAMEASFGADFSSVRVHTGSSAVQMSQGLNAHAFTVGNDIFFNKDKYQPHTKEGAGLLAHELTHTVQQGAAVQNKSISRNPFSAMLSKHEGAHLSAGSADGLNRKEMAQLQDKWPEDETVQQQLLQTKGVDEVNKKDSSLSMRRCPQKAKKNKKAKLKSGPTYTPNGTLTATLGSDGKKYSPRFALSAEFEDDPSKGIYASCGQIRQYIKWSSNADRPNHSGFTPASSYAANTWYEDRNSGNAFRYGHRSGTFGYSTGTNKYIDAGGSTDMAKGPKYEGSDRPVDGSGAKTGTWDFRLDAIDTCNGNKVLGSDTLTVDW